VRKRQREEKRGEHPKCFESGERKGKPLYLHQHLHPKKGKRCIKEGTWSQEQQCHPPTPIDRPLLCHQPSFLFPPTPKNTQEEEQGCDELKHKICLQPSPHLCFSCSLKLSLKNNQASSSLFLVICVVVSGSYF
jgi:hypothetical protein